MNWRKWAIISWHSFSTKASYKGIDRFIKCAGWKRWRLQIEWTIQGLHTWLCIRTPGRSFVQTDTTSLGPWTFLFPPSLQGWVCSQLCTTDPGEHWESSTSALQLIIKLGFFQLRLFQPVDPLRGKAFQDFLTQYKGKSMMKQSQLYLT